MKDNERPPLHLAGPVDTVKAQFNALSEADQTALVEFLATKQAIREFPQIRADIPTEERFKFVSETYDVQDLIEGMQERPWLYRAVSLAALARRTSINDGQRPRVIRRVIETLEGIHRGTLNYSEDFLYEKRLELAEGNITAAIIGRRGRPALKGLAQEVGSIFGEDFYPESFPRRKGTFFSFTEFSSRQNMRSPRRLGSIDIQLRSYGIPNFYLHRKTKGNARFTESNDVLSTEGAENLLSKMLEIDDIASRVIISAIVALPREIEMYFEERARQYGNLLERLEK